MQREAVLHTLSAHKQELSAKYGVTRLGIFGSVARDQATDTSDVDIIVEMPPDLFQMVHMKDDLEQMLAASVDLIRYHKHLNDYLKHRIDNEAIFVCSAVDTSILANIATAIERIERRFVGIDSADDFIADDHGVDRRPKQ